MGVAGEIDGGLREDGMKCGEDVLGFAKGGIEGGLISSVESFGVDGSYGFFHSGKKVFAGSGKCGQDVGGGRRAQRGAGGGGGPQLQP